MSQPEIVVPLALQHTQQATCSSPWYLINTEYPPAAAAFEPLINGEVAFRAVHQAIAQAKKSIDIICWGFQPSMYFIRDGSAPCIGELLMAKARKGVAVRILGWEFPFNSAGIGGEANLPGKGPFRLWDRALQRSTQEQYAYDREWFNLCAMPDNMAAALRAERNIPVFVGRGFSLFERAEIAYQARYKSLDPQLSLDTNFAMTIAPTHHQKAVLVDYELEDSAVGFVMGHNMLDEYWDTDDHSALNRSEDAKPAPNRGPRGDTPRQDISSRVSGPILEHLHHNFATAWRKETGEDLFALRQARQVGPQLQCMPGATEQLVQLVRTQPQDGKCDIQALHFKAINNATQFIYIENQYFRWPPLAEAIKQAAAVQTRAGRDPGLHGALHLFVITNATDDGIGAGTVNTQRMLESLGRADTMPQVTKLRRIEQVQAQADKEAMTLAEMLEMQALITLTSLTDALGGGDASGKAKDARQQRFDDSRWRQAVLKDKIREIEESTITPEPIPGLKIHVCSLVAPDSPAGKPWMPVYIHSKLMIVNDVFTTLGSANINERSMLVDSELNIAHEWASETQALRRELWRLHTDNKGAQDDPAEAFKEWQVIINKNKDYKKEEFSPYAPLIEFIYNEAILKNLD
ncbi:phosphatidylserine/phosphatidylglycerophosphate/cardiolipin synthase family protein [Pseudomonas sp. BJa5]|uniref:phospholipase D-like domain-containing protein n=1 Tax=Pseudomonas sp. BJa5 TaxID=2936270 RepID=UPI00255A1ABF|nr:phosphatidylserine/phosphatidylglycerophosphate/cardiolipin synthase family protein [Pseudomonas sp. BGr12]MDL2423961.1 phosphatidylserine/phosphatidylglycerophosphate/cardiolipin synthase family protein [Pseudomonas sp. BGr12]